MIRIFLAACIGLILAGCSNKPPVLGGSPDLAVVDALPQPYPTDSYVTQDAYVIGPNDVLKVDLVGFPDMSNRTIRVDQGGRISFPLAGSLLVAGRTTAEAAEMIAEGLRRSHVREPQVAVNIEATSSRSIAVFGEVREPGVFQVPGRTTLMRTIAMAKGFGELGRQDDVVIYRTVGGQRMATLHNLGAIERGMYPDPEVYPNDLVVVGRDNARRLFQDVVSAATIVTAPLTILLQRN